MNKDKYTKLLLFNYYNAIIYENRTCHFLKFSKLSMIVSVLIVATLSLSMNNIIAFDKNSYFILLQRLVLIIYPKK